MKNAASIFGKQVRNKYGGPKIEWPLPEQLIGLEVEVEMLGDTSPASYLVPYWRKTTDGSLRDGVEYVLSTPLKGDTLSAAISQLFHGDTKFNRSTTGSTHVHIDMMEEETTGTTIKVMVLLMFAVESAMFNIADPGREWCGYTNKLASAPDDLLFAVVNCSEESNYHELVALCGGSIEARLAGCEGRQYGTSSSRNGVGRYYGLNLLALQEHGSIEFRYFPTATSPEELANWVELVQQFKRAALDINSLESLEHILSSEHSYEEFINSYFYKWRDIFLTHAPQYVALGQFHKAMACAAARHMGNTNGPTFNDEAILGSSVLKKFVKVSKKAQPKLTAILTPLGDRAPSCNESEDETVLIYDGDMYRAVDRSWTSLTPEHVRDLPVPRCKRLLRVLTDVWPNLVPNARRVGYTETQVSRLHTRIELMIHALNTEPRVVADRLRQTEPRAVASVPAGEIRQVRVGDAVYNWGRLVV